MKTQKIKRKFSGLSFHWSRHFVMNIVVVVGVIAVWRGMWNLIDEYFFPGNPLFSNIASIILGLFLLYLPDASFSQLGEIERKKK